MPTNLVRDSITPAWRDGVIALAHEASKLEDEADYVAGQGYYSLRHALLVEAREYYEAILHLEQAIGQHEDAFYQRIRPADECTCHAREGEPLCPVCERVAANRPIEF